MIYDDDAEVMMPRRIGSHRRRPGGSSERTARGLGWLSIGLGVAQVLAPRTVARLTGVPVPPALMVLCGVRELACGIGILAQPKPTSWINVRVAGDALDLAGLTAGFAIPGADPRRIAIATAAVAGITALDVYCARDLSARMKRAPLYVTSSIIVERRPAELYLFWRDLENLPRIMPHLESVRLTGANRSHWVSRGPWGRRIEWHSELIDDVPNQRLAWRTIDGSEVYNAGSVRFQAAGAGNATEVTVELLYEPPAGTIATTVAKLFGKGGEREVGADLQTFKRLMERGDIAFSPAHSLRSQT